MTSASSPAYLARDWRYAGDDWSGANALTYIAGTGCLVAWSGSAWQVAGTATTVSA